MLVIIFCFPLHSKLFLASIDDDWFNVTRPILYIFFLLIWGLAWKQIALMEEIAYHVRTQPQNRKREFVTQG